MIRSSISDRIATITLDSPDTCNAISFPDTLELARVVAEVSGSGDVDALVLTGAGEFFSAGADLGAVGGADDVVAYVVDGLRTSVPAFATAMLESPVPTVAAVNGPAIGGGVGLALFADVTIARRSGYFQLAQVNKWGIAPDAGGSCLPIARVGRARALGLAALGERLSADDAASWGLIWSSVADDEFAAEVDRTARRLAADPQAVVMARTLIDAAPSRSIAEGLMAECDAMAQLVSRPRVMDALALLAAPS